MDLKEFISETIVQIVAGVVDAQEKTKELGAKVSPKLTGASHFSVQHRFLSAEGGATQIVQFDVALTAKEGA